MPRQAPNPGTKGGARAGQHDGTAGRHHQQNNHIPNFGTHVHEDGEVCQGFHGLDRCPDDGCTAWGLENTVAGTCSYHNNERLKITDADLMFPGVAQHLFRTGNVVS
ncbi:MAG: hypothetical protein WEA10_04935 [Actinomycetota bacterium]